MAGVDSTWYWAVQRIQENCGSRFWRKLGPSYTEVIVKLMGVCQHLFSPTWAICLRCIFAIKQEGTKGSCKCRYGRRYLKLCIWNVWWLRVPGRMLMGFFPAAVLKAPIWSTWEIHGVTGPSLNNSSRPRSSGHSNFTLRWRARRERSTEVSSWSISTIILSSSIRRRSAMKRAEWLRL